MNIGEMARRSGVSRSTVVVRARRRRAVAEATRRRVQEVIDEHDYRPNAAARALKEGRTRTLGLVIPPAGGRLTYMQLEFVASVVEAGGAAAPTLTCCSPPRGATTTGPSNGSSAGAGWTG